MRKRRALSRKAQGLVEYALILALIGVVAIVIISLLGGQINTMFSTLASAM